MLIRANLPLDRARALMHQFSAAPLGPFMAALHLAPVNAQLVADTVHVYAEDGPNSATIRLDHNGDYAAFAVRADDNEGALAATAFRAMVASTGALLEVA